MRNQYVMEFAKEGYMKYISHLDMVRLFKMAFKRAGIQLVYSNGFNPHPKMRFAQPLSLGYASSCELFEFETKENQAAAEIMERIIPVVPKGIEIFNCSELPDGKSLAAKTFAAAYELVIPVAETLHTACEAFAVIPGIDEVCNRYLGQDRIMAWKYQKKIAAKKEIDIKPMIRTLVGRMDDNKIILYTELDCGSESNLSPELLISSFLAFTGFNIKREEIDVTRTKLFFI